MAVTRAVPSALSCSCGCCRISSETLLLIGVTLSQMQSGSGLPQCGQSGTTSSAGPDLRPDLRPDLGLTCSDMRPLYASWPAIQLFGRRGDRGWPGSLPQPVDQEIDHRRGVERQDLRN